MSESAATASPRRHRWRLLLTALLAVLIGVAYALGWQLWTAYIMASVYILISPYVSGGS